MSVTARLAAFALAIGVVFAASAAAGRAVDPVHDDVVDTMGAGHAHEDAGGHGSTGHEETTGHSGVSGLSIADEALRLEIDEPVLATGSPRPFSFRIFDRSGDVVTDFDPEQGGVELHLVVVGRDLSGFQHLHPEMAPDGTWSTPLTLATAGAHRAFVDVTVDGEAHTLGADLFAPGPFAPVSLPAPAGSSTVDGYEVHLTSPDLVSGQSVDLSFSVERDGVPVTGLEPYLGARGHLVGLRQGDLAYLHLHPEEAAAADDPISFAGSFPSAGTYRLFLQFQHEGVVRTAPFTVEVPQ